MVLLFKQGGGSWTRSFVEYDDFSFKARLVNSDSPAAATSPVAGAAEKK